jgi:hypothetical protein
MSSRPAWAAYETASKKKKKKKKKSQNPTEAQLTVN